MALFGDWNGDGKNNQDDDFIEYMILSGALNEERRQNNGGGCCLFSFVLLISPFIGVIWLIGNIIHAT